MADLTVDELLDLIEQNGGPAGLALRGRDLNGLRLGQAHILEKLQERGYTSLEPAELLERWKEHPTWVEMREKGYVHGTLPPWLSELTFGLNLSQANLSPDASNRSSALSGANLQHANLWGANLQHANLRGANLQHANLRGANLQHALLWEVKLQHADFAGANLQHAILWGANLQHANLRGANLQHAFPMEANLQHANLYGANLQHANLWRADLQHAFLSDTQGLEEAYLGGVDWSQGYVLGEEDDGKYAAGEVVYRRLKQWYSRNGQYDHAGEFHYRERECRRKEVQKR